MHKKPIRYWIAIATTLLFTFSASASDSAFHANFMKENEAKHIFSEHCKSAGERIYRTINDVDSVLLLKVRPFSYYESQFEQNDPYGRDFSGEGYIASFLQSANKFRESGSITSFNQPVFGYSYVDVIDPSDGKRYRYKGHLEEPWQVNKSYLKGYIRHVMQKSTAPDPAPRYGVTYEDISTQDDLQHWVAGSSLKILDLQTNEVIAERIGYLYDPQQGSTTNGRVPWLMAADYACPSFVANATHSRQPAAVSQTGQTLRFVNKILKPTLYKGK